jgi:hypothetical protein
MEPLELKGTYEQYEVMLSNPAFQDVVDFIGRLAQDASETLSINTRLPELQPLYLARLVARREVLEDIHTVLKEFKNPHLKRMKDAEDKELADREGFGNQTA